MANETDWVTDVRRWVQDRARATSTDPSGAAATNPRPTSDGSSQFGYEAADSAVAGRYHGLEKSAHNADKDPR
jgi:hypothetical protein